jgi:thioesterase domain-containing protein/acyl carrier protein
VGEAVVIAREDSPGDKRLVAYVVGQKGVELSAGELRSELSGALPEYMVPSAFVTLETMPLTPNGKLDRAALPAPDQSAVVTRAYEAPLGEIEVTIARIWQELLGVERVGRHDNFFELGGHSLLTIKLVHTIKRQFDLVLPLAMIFRAPTLTTLATMVKAGHHATQLVVPLQSQSVGKPLFCIHPVGGQVSCYQELAYHLGGEFPVYGIQSPEAAGLSFQFNTIERMAFGYSEAIRAIQQTGPYRLIGWSTGGIIAMAVARALNDQGEKIQYLGLLDSRPLHKTAVIEEELLLSAVLSTLAALRKDPFTSEELSAMKGTLEEIKIQIQDLFCLESERTVLPYLEKWVRRRITSDLFEHVKLQTEISYHHLKTLWGFAPKEEGMPLHLFWTNGDQERSPAKDLQRYDRSEAISCVEGAKTYFVGGNHYNMLQDPHVREIANYMSIALR